MNYLRVTNKGLIYPEDLMLIGSSTKREQSGKIGMFGSGWKYALAWLLRNDCTPIIFAGTEKIEIDFSLKMHRDKAVKVITVNGNETSLTTEMGPKWSGWMALREIISNAIDEGGYTMGSDYNPTFKGAHDTTTIYIPLNTELGNVMLNFNSYFSFERKPSWECEQGKIFIKEEPSKLNIYRKGIKCYDTTTQTTIDFDLDEVNINEDRLSNSYDIGKSTQKIINSISNGTLLQKILEQKQNWWIPYGDISDSNIVALKELIDAGNTFTTDNILSLTGSIMSSAKSLSIPQPWYDRLRELKLIKSAFQLLGSNIQFIRTDEKDLKGIQYYLAEYNVTMNMQSGSCNREAIFHKGIGYINADTKLSDKEIAARLLGTSTENFWKEKMGLPVINSFSEGSIFDDDMPF